MRKRLSETFTWYERYDSCFKPLPMQYKRKLTTPSFSWWYSLIKTLDRLEKGNPFWKRYVCFENVCADLTPAIINQYCPDQIYSVSTWLYHQGTVSRIKTDWLFWSWKKAQLTPHNHKSRIPNMTVTKGFYIMSGILMRSLKRNPNKQLSFPSPPSAGASGFILLTSK